MRKSAELRKAEIVAAVLDLAASFARALGRPDEAIAVAGLFISVGAAQFADRRLPRRPSRKNATVAMN